MTTIRYFVLTVAAALVLTACDNATDPSGLAKTPPAAPTVDALVTLEKSAFEAWKSKDAKFWDTFLSDRFVGYGSSGRVDKASSIRETTSSDCEIKSYALSDEQMKPLGTDAALLTFKTTVDGTCGGQEVPADSWAASVYVRDGDKWKAAFHAEAPIVDGIMVCGVFPRRERKAVAALSMLPTDRYRPRGRYSGVAGVYVLTPVLPAEISPLSASGAPTGCQSVLARYSPMRTFVPVVVTSTTIWSMTILEAANHGS
jgi:hypothetical protein